jgi:Rad3-related DNA helicase
MRIQLENAILIIDEAHNIGQAAEEAFSFEITTDHLSKIQYELLYLLKKVSPNLYEEVKSKCL